MVLYLISLAKKIGLTVFSSIRNVITTRTHYYSGKIFNNCSNNKNKVVIYSFTALSIYNMHYKHNVFFNFKDAAMTGIKNSFKNIFTYPLLQDYLLKILENLFKDKELIDIQLKQLTNAIKSDAMIENSKPFGKDLIVRIIKSNEFVDFSKDYFTIMLKEQKVLDSSVDLAQSLSLNSDVINSWADVFTRGCLDHKDTFDILIEALNNSGVKALTDDKTKDHIGVVCFSVVNNEKFLKAIKKSTVPFLYPGY